MTPVKPRQTLPPAISDQTSRSPSAQPAASARTRKYAGEHDILAACRSGDVQWLEQQLQKDTSLIHQDYLSGKKTLVSPLYIACQEGYDNIVQLLLEQRVDVNRPTSNGRTPLVVACARGRNNIVQKLLQQPEIMVNSVAGDYPPLLAATIAGNRDAVAQLLQFPGLDVNAVGPQGATPLAMASLMGLTEIVSLLASHPTIAINGDGKHNIPLRSAVHSGSREVVAQLLQHPAIDVNAGLEGNNFTPLQIAAMNGDMAIVEQLLAMPGIDIDIKNHAGFNAASLARHQNHHEIAMLLARVRGASSVDAPELPPNQGESISANSSDGGMALMVAAHCGHSSMIGLLLKQQGINVNAATKSGATSLFMAAQEGHADVVQQLLEKGADPTLEVRVNLIVSCSPLQAARINNHQEVVDLLLAAEQRLQKNTEQKPELSLSSE